MRKIHIVALLAAAFLTHPVFANDMDMASSDSKSCAMIAKACLDAGFSNTNMTDKRFWQDCMKPVVLGQTVQGVTIDSSTVKTCRSDKITQLKKEVAEFQKASR